MRTRSIACSEPTHSLGIKTATDLLRGDQGFHDFGIGEAGHIIIRLQGDSHRTIRNRTNEAVRRRHLAPNPALLAKASKLTEEEPEHIVSRKSNTCENRYRAP